MPGTTVARPPRADDPAPPPADPVSTAAEHATSRVPVAAPSDRAGEVLDGLRGRRFDSAEVVAVCAGERLVGLVLLERLLAAAPTASLGTIMDCDPPTVHQGAAQEQAAWLALQRDEPGLAVVDDAGSFVGLIPPQRLLAVLLAEHDEDVARLSGFLASTRRARLASTEPVARRLLHRLPWLLLGLAGALASAVLVGGFEEDLERQVLLALFVPGVVYLADAVGTQTEALVIRGLSVGVSIMRIALREVVTGLALGVLLAALALPAVWALWHSWPIALAVSVALFTASAIATVVAMALPWLFSKLGTDPAYGSGPLATVVQDLLSILIYFLTATALVL